MRTCIIYLLIFIIGFSHLSGQPESPEHDLKDQIFFNLKNINFVRNNEYSNPVTEGYTLIGYFLQPEVIYIPDEKLKLSFGGHFLSYSGTGRFTEVRPVFSTTYYFTGSSYFRIGSLSGSDAHRLLDPHFSREFLYSDYCEDGLQLVASGNQFFSDTWLNWENFIFRGDNDREIFTAGESFRYSLPLISSITLEFPIQIMFRHYGGQISNYPEPVETYLNFAAGIKASAAVDKDRKSTAGIESYFLSGNCLTGNASSGIKNGYAGWHKVFFSSGGAEVNAGFWHSDNYFAPSGNYIFGSVSDHIRDLVISERRLVTGSVSIKLPFKDLLEFYLGFDGYYDTDLRRFDNAATLHLRFDQLIRIDRISRNRR